MTKTEIDKKSQASAESIWGSSGKETINIKTRETLEPPALIARQNTKLTQKAYTPLGKLKRVLFAEVSDAAIKDKSNPLLGNKRNFLHLDWMGIGPTIGVGLDGEDFLVTESLPEPPKIADPASAPQNVLQRDMVVGLRKQGQEWASIAKHLCTSIERCKKAAALPAGADLWPEYSQVEQTVWHRSYGPISLNGDTWECFQPITQIEISSVQKKGFIYLNCVGPDSRDRHGALIWNPSTKKAHIVYGRFEVSLPPMD